VFSQTGNIIKSDTVVIVGEISITGNKITKDKIITRELEFKQNDTLTTQQLRKKIVKSRENLLNRQIFNFVTITETDTLSIYRNINIDVVERWYIWPVPIFGLADRNFNVWWETKDFGRINYGIDIKHDNFRGRMEKLHLLLQNGYDKKVVGKWVIPYIDKNQKLGLTVAGGLQYNHGTDFTDIQGKPVFYKFYNEFARKRYFAEFGLSLRPGFNTLHFFNVNYNNLWYNDSLLIFNPYLTYGENHFQFMEISYGIKLDYRDYAPYPLKGYYFDFNFKKIGLGLFKNGINLWNATFSFDQYIQIYKKLYFAYNISAYYSNDDTFQPYIFLNGIGYNNFSIRGYELVVVKGEKMMIFKSNMKIEIIPMQVHRIKFIKSEKFGKLFYAIFGNVFYDMGYANNMQEWYENPYSNQILWTVGVGLDIISFYSIVIRLEYSVNKQRQTGFYIGMTAPI
jgi:outer membrane protein assembly factor BamA